MKYPFLQRTIDVLFLDVPRDESIMIEDLSEIIKAARDEVSFPDLFDRGIWDFLHKRLNFNEQYQFHDTIEHLSVTLEQFIDLFQDKKAAKENDFEKIEKEF